MESLNDSPVLLSFPAETLNVALARTLAVTMAARAHLTVDQIEDVRLAVDEAVSQLILGTYDGAVINCTFEERMGTLSIHVTAPSLSGVPPDRTTFSWTVMNALVDNVEASVDDGLAHLHLLISRPASITV